MGKLNQGLQIALILFALIAIVLGVTTFTFKKQKEEVSMQCEEALKKAATADALYKTTDDELNELKRIVGGYEGTVTISKIKEDAKNILDEIQPGMEDANYVSALETLRKNITALNEDLVKKDAGIAKLDGLYKTRSEEDRQKVAKLDDNLGKVRTQLKVIRGDIDKIIAESTSTSAQMLKDLREKLNSADSSIKEAEKRKDDAMVALQEQEKRMTKLKNELLKSSEDTPVLITVQGQITSVYSDGLRGTINLGSSNQISRGISFSVYKEGDLTDQGKKGTIEVLSIQSERTSEVKIESLDYRDPIHAGDVIFTPTWSPNVKEHFALIGFMDMDKNGKHDYRKLIALIQQNGGLVDSWMDDEGNQQGVIDHNTNWVIQGTKPDDKSTEEQRNTNKNMLDQQERNSVKKMALSTLLARMGYIPNAHKQSSAEKHRLPRTEGVSTGDVSALHSGEKDASGARKSKPNKKTAY